MHIKVYYIIHSLHLLHVSATLAAILEEVHYKVCITNGCERYCPLTVLKLNLCYHRFEDKEVANS